METLKGRFISSMNKTVAVIGGIVYPGLNDMKLPMFFETQEEFQSMKEKGWKVISSDVKTRADENGETVVEGISAIMEKEITEEEAKLTMYQDGKGYIDNEGYVWIYCLNKPAKACRNEYPYFWKNKNMELEFSNPTQEILDGYCLEKIKDLSKVSVIQETKDDEQLFNEEEINDVNAATSFYVPLLKESDDFLKKVVKATIILKKIDINRLKVKTEQKYILPNMRSVLDTDTKMSTVNFIRWMELLGCSFDIIINNDGSDTELLKNPIIYQSHRDSLGEIIEGEIIDLNTGSFVMDREDMEVA